MLNLWDQISGNDLQDCLSLIISDYYNYFLLYCCNASKVVKEDRLLDELVENKEVVSYMEVDDIKDNNCKGSEIVVFSVLEVGWDWAILFELVRLFRHSENLMFLSEILGIFDWISFNFDW